MVFLLILSVCGSHCTAVQKQDTQGDRSMEKEQTKEPAETGTMADSKEIMATAMEAGHILLENGAEISRVEDTMMRICTHFGVQNCHFFVLSNGIFTTGAEENKDNRSFAEVQHIPVRSASLDRVIAVNQLSRDVAESGLSVSEVKQELERIRRSPGKPVWHQILASGFGSACFCYLFGGSPFDSLGSFLAGILLYAFLLFPGKRLSKIFQNVAGGALVTLICFLNWRLGIGNSWSNMVIGAIIPLVPGVPFINGIRDIADGDYIAGSVRLLDACLTFGCIAIGVGCMFSVIRSQLGLNGLLHPAELHMNEWILIWQCAAAFLGTISFALLYNVPVRFYLACGVVGSSGWLIYSLMIWYTGVSAAFSTLIATAAIVLLCRWFAVLKTCPATVFVITGIFPLVPGAGIFWTSYQLVEAAFHEAMLTGFNAVKCSIAIVLAIVAVFEVPYRFFTRKQKRQ